MNYDEMLQQLKALNEEQGIDLIALPHCSNLIHQLEKNKAADLGLYNTIFPLYLQTRTVEYTGDLRDYIERLTDAVNSYMDFYWPPANNPFSHQSDFTSSIIPEMLCTLFGRIIKENGVEGLEVSAEKDLTIECTFDISDGGVIRFKNKRVDVAVVKPCPLNFNGQESVLPVPLIAIECKTNLDKNMLSGIEQSVSDLKKTFPECFYYVVSELSDFDVRKSNYASSGIDEIYILRKQKRGPVRTDPTRRNAIHTNLLYELSVILIEGMRQMGVESVDLNTRMLNGKLIGRVL